MRSDTKSVVEGFRLDFEEGKRNRFADDAGPDHSLGVSMARYRDQRLNDLAQGAGPLFFGRLWLEDDEDYRLGRRHVRDEDDRSVALVIDWRARLAERFYRASPHRRMEVMRRRRYGFGDGRLTGFEDEDLGHGTDGASRFMQREIERPRTGPMRDIVSTIQPDQDELIRRGADVTICVQGAPGTGKTAVGLHRAAWLLYTFPERFSRGGMLVVGPNDGFLRYISGVLPALGETSVAQTTVDELTGAATATAEKDDAVHRLKHEARMSEVCERAVWQHRGTVDGPVDIRFKGSTATLDPQFLIDARERARSSTRGWSAGRVHLESAVVEAVRRHVELRNRLTPDARWVAALRRSPDVKDLMGSLWPKLTAKQVHRRLLTDDVFRRRAADGVLEEAEIDLLARRSTKPTSADALLLDEIGAQLDGPTAVQTYTHVVVDEAQDLSPMQCRAVARRCPSGSLTVLGDLAQGTMPWSAQDWADHMAHLGQDTVEHTTMTIGYRVPAAILSVANRLVPHLGVSVEGARSVRRDGTVATIQASDLAAATASAVREALRGEGMIGVISSESVLETVAAMVPADARVELIPAHRSKGLEFDHVIVVEPGGIVDEATGHHGGRVIGLRRLYVALTRGVSHLTVVHADALPAELEDPTVS
ncbi:MAG: AAA family ATPase [Intrasporangiaceae bacterium]|nr:AAA family ATPase [Intrasporangiaceae bacterium]